VIAIVDYGMGNLRSVQKAFQRIGADARIATKPEEVERAEAAVLPGVGAFGAAMQALKQSGMADVLKTHIHAGKPFLGICLGFQLLFEGSEESPGEPGLGIFAGRVVGFKSQPGFRLPVPHTGWNTLQLNLNCPFWAGLMKMRTGTEAFQSAPRVPHPTFVAEPPCVYFVHSYYPEPEDSSLVAATTEYGLPFVCAIARKNLFAVQFHPEKSGEVGLRILENFVSISE
jgi:glutamine amidotransferase